MSTKPENAEPENKFAKIIRSLTLIRAEEQKAVLAAFFFVFILMASYYILRPVRDSLASNWSNTEISMLWNIQFFLSVGLVALFGYAVSHIRFKFLVQGVYILFAISFIVFQLGSTWISNPVLIDKGFYIWVSLFSLFHLSVFWSFMADLFTKEQAGRVFAVIAVGASAGSIFGPLVAALVVSVVGSDYLISIASLLLLVSVPLVYYLQYLKSIDLHNTELHGTLNQFVVGGKALEGFKEFFNNRFLIGIAIFIALYTAISSFAYFEQTNLLRAYDQDQRTQILAVLSLVVNVLTFGLGFFATSRLVTRFGMPTTLAIMPLVMCVALLILAFVPILLVLIVLQIARQAGNYGVTRPAREMLFTVVSRESRFKAKPVVDVVMYRGSDAVWAIGFAALTDGLGLSLAAMGLIGALIAVVWAVTGIYLGRRFNENLAAAEVNIENPNLAQTNA